MVRHLYGTMKGYTTGRALSAHSCYSQVPAQIPYFSAAIEHDEEEAVAQSAPNSEERPFSSARPVPQLQESCPLPPEFKMRVQYMYQWTS